MAANGDNGDAIPHVPAVNIADLRREYHRAELTETDVDPDALQQFDRWLADAIRAELPEPTAMTLATVDAHCRPAARIVLLKARDAGGFVFFTNYDSRKGQDLAAHPASALLFHWAELERQVRIEGTAVEVAAEESDAYFASRPERSRIGAWASPQSCTIPDRTWLEREFTAATARFDAAGGEVPRPPRWGGYRVIPSMLEFWQGRRSRLHDRICYRREGPHWHIERLAP